MEAIEGVTQVDVDLELDESFVDDAVVGSSESNGNEKDKDKEKDKVKTKFKMSPSNTATSSTTPSQPD